MAASAEALLRVWEDNQHAHPVRRALRALAAAAPEGGANRWAQAPIGVRDRALLHLQEQLFGSALHTTADCPTCGERLESDFTVPDVGGARPEQCPPAATAAAIHLQEQGFDIEYRLPTSDDLLEILAVPSDASDAVRLLRRCVSRAQRGGTPLDPAALPESLVDRIADGMAAHDPDADVRVGLACPACGTAWQVRFDIVTYFWSELDDWAQRMLADVHTLARAYGWSEQAILALSPARRQLYLEMVAA